MARSKRRNTKAERRRKLRRAQRHPKRMGHETMLQVARPMKAAVDALVTKLQRPSGEPVELVSEAALGDSPEVDEVLHSRYAVVRQVYGWSHEASLNEIQLLATHIQCATNHVLGGRKVFWVDGELANMLSETTLDISGDLMELPFPACAFLFDSRDTLGRLQKVADAERGERPGQVFQMLTVYASPLPVDADDAGIRLVLMADAFDREWPYLIARDIPTDGKRGIDEILGSHPDESTDPFFRLPELRDLVHLVINAILYTTCREFRSETRRPPPRKQAVKQGNLSGETVFYLPGKIPIGGSQSDRDRSSESGRSIGKRFWVRGHWRRPTPTWQDQRLRWIAPYLKGPEMTAIIEREYELRDSSKPTTKDIG